MVYYHADGENDTLYSYSDIVTIYKTLYNNKIYNQIYTETLCSWINDNLTAKWGLYAIHYSHLLICLLFPD